MLATYIEKITPKLAELGVEIAQSSIRILLVILAAYIGIKFLRVALDRLEAFLVRASAGADVVPGSGAKRIRTLISVLWTVAVVLIWFVVVLTTLGQIGINLAPVLAGAGVVGLAVGFGAQSLVKDLVSGFFLILENQVRVGDVAIVNGTGGLVEAITFRTVVLRDLSAVVHVFPNGSINTLANLTKEWSAYVIDVGVAYKEDTDQVVEVMKKVAAEMQEDAAYSSAMLAPIEVFGVDDFGDSAVTIKARLKTMPLQQWNVGREYRRRLKKAFDAQRIEIPFPHRTLYMGEASPPFELLMKNNQPHSPAQQ